MKTQSIHIFLSIGFPAIHKTLKFSDSPINGNMQNKSYHRFLVSIN